MWTQGLCCCCSALSCIWFFATPWTTARQASLSFSISQSLLRLTSIDSMKPCNHLLLNHPLLLLPSIFPSIRVFSNDWALHNRHWSTCCQSTGALASASVLSVNIQGWFPLVLTGLISLKSRGFLSLLQQYSLEASILQHSAFYMDQLSHLYMTTGKIIALIIWTFVGKMMSLLFNMLSNFVIALLPRSKRFSISWLQSL